MEKPVDVFLGFLALQGLIVAGLAACAPPPPTAGHDSSTGGLVLVCLQDTQEVFRKEVEGVETYGGIIYLYQLDGVKHYLSANDAAFCFTTPKAQEVFAGKD